MTHPAGFQFLTPVAAVIAAGLLLAVPCGCTHTSAPVESGRTALDRYVARPDPAYAWEVVETNRIPGVSAYAISLTSQNWLTPAEVNRTLWKHWLLVVKPDAAAHDTALLFISGGNNKDNKIPKPSAEIIRLAQQTHSMVAELRMVPNQPLIFGNDGKERVEDSLIAYTWDKFLRTGDERWPARLPMTKAAVRALDTITAFSASPAGGGRTINKFVVAGGSKRGWTTWTTAAVDPRVVAICPIVIDVLNIEPSMMHHFQAYGFYAPSVGDYVEQGIMDWIGSPQMKKLCAIEEPYSYRSRFTMPKLLLNACGDQFFVPDSSQFYFDQLPGVKYLRYVPNADHSLKGSDAWETLLAWHFATLNHSQLPQFTWKHESSGSVTVHSMSSPREVRFWQATNPAARDFRLETLGPVWTSTVLTPDASHNYRGRVGAPVQGWTAFFAEMTYDIGAPMPLKVTTDVGVVPEVLPHPAPKSKH